MAADNTAQNSPATSNTATNTITQNNAVQEVDVNGVSVTVAIPKDPTDMKRNGENFLTYNAYVKKHFIKALTVPTEDDLRKEAKSALYMQKNGSAEPFYSAVMPTPFTDAEVQEWVRKKMPQAREFVETENRIRSDLYTKYADDFKQHWVQEEAQRIRYEELNPSLYQKLTKGTWLDPKKKDSENGESLQSKEDFYKAKGMLPLTPVDKRIDQKIKAAQTAYLLEGTAIPAADVIAAKAQEEYAKDQEARSKTIAGLDKEYTAYAQAFEKRENAKLVTEKYPVAMDVAAGVSLAASVGVAYKLRGTTPKQFASSANNLADSARGAITAVRDALPAMFTKTPSPIAATALPAVNLNQPAAVLAEIEKIKASIESLATLGNGLNKSVGRQVGEFVLPGLTSDAVGAVAMALDAGSAPPERMKKIKDTEYWENLAARMGMLFVGGAIGGKFASRAADAKQFGKFNPESVTILAKELDAQAAPLKLLYDRVEQKYTTAAATDLTITRGQILADIVKAEARATGHANGAAAAADHVVVPFLSTPPLYQATGATRTVPRP